MERLTCASHRVQNLAWRISGGDGEREEITVPGTKLKNISERKWRKGLWSLEHNREEESSSQMGSVRLCSSAEGKGAFGGWVSDGEWIADLHRTCKPTKNSRCCSLTGCWRFAASVYHYHYEPTRACVLYFSEPFRYTQGPHSSERIPTSAWYSLFLLFQHLLPSPFTEALFPLFHFLFSLFPPFLSPCYSLVPLQDFVFQGAPPSSRIPALIAALGLPLELSREASGSLTYPFGEQSAKNTWL